jgi:hypothetical protein
MSDLIYNLHKIKDILPELWNHVLLYDPTMDFKAKEKTMQYANINYWLELSTKKDRSFHYHRNKLYKNITHNTCAIQAQVEGLMLETLDGLL